MHGAVCCWAAPVLTLDEPDLQIWLEGDGELSRFGRLTKVARGSTMERSSCMKQVSSAIVVVELSLFKDLAEKTLYSMLDTHNRLVQVKGYMQ